MNTEYRILTADDVEQSAYVEAVAFYNEPGPARVELAKKYLSPEWTVGAFIDGKLVADARMLPMVRRMNGGAMDFAAIGPVACLSAYRRQGHVARLLRYSLEIMRERGQVMSGLFTPHDALYARYGWERAEGRYRYEFFPKDIHLRHHGAAGRLEQVGRDAWQRLDAIYQEHVRDRNGPFARNPAWWQVVVLGHLEPSGELKDNENFAWVSPEGRDEGYLTYTHRTLPQSRDYPDNAIHVRDFVALTPDACIGLWQHLLTHDLARYVAVYMPPEDPFPDLVHDPFRITVTPRHGAMLRIVDVEQAVALRPYVGQRPVSFNIRVLDHSAPWNEATWRIEAAEGRMRAEKTDAEPDLELTAGALAPIFVGHRRPQAAAGVGLLRVFRPEAVEEMAEAFRVLHPPYCHDDY